MARARACFGHLASTCRRQTTAPHESCEHDRLLSSHQWWLRNRSLSEAWEPLRATRRYRLIAIGKKPASPQTKHRICQAPWTVAGPTRNVNGLALMSLHHPLAPFFSTGIEYGATASVRLRRRPFASSSTWACEPCSGLAATDTSRPQNARITTTSSRLRRETPRVGSRRCRRSGSSLRGRPFGTHPSLESSCVDVRSSPRWRATDRRAAI